MLLAGLPWPRYIVSSWEWCFKPRMALDISDISLPDTSVAPELFSGWDHPASIKKRVLYHQGLRISACGLISLCVHMCAHVFVWESERARAITPTLIDWTSVCMSDHLSHRWHRITGHIRGARSRFGIGRAARSLLLFSGVVEHSCTPVLLEWTVSCVTLTCHAECNIRKNIL